MALHEQECFAESCRINLEQITPFDLLDRRPTMEEILRFDTLMVGGSGDFYVTRGNLPGFEELMAVFREVVDVGHPTFASCFGYQCLVSALGGVLVHDTDATEVGTYPLSLTAAGREDPLFGFLPSNFNAQLGRKDRATAHPAGIPNLAQSERSPFQALRIPDKPIWATQFHPELDRKTNQDRYQHYLEGYAQYMNPELPQEVESRFDTSREASELLFRFLELVFD